MSTRPTPNFSRITRKRTGNFDLCSTKQEVCYDLAWSDLARELHRKDLPTALLFPADQDPDEGFSDLHDEERFEEGLLYLFGEKRARVLAGDILAEMENAKGYLCEHYAEEDLLRAQYAVDLAKWQAEQAVEALTSADRHLAYANERMAEREAVAQ